MMEERRLADESAGERHEGDKEDYALSMAPRQREKSQEMSENAWSPAGKNR